MKYTIILKECASIVTKITNYYFLIRYIKISYVDFNNKS